MSSQDDVLCKHCDNFYTLRHWKWCKPCQINNIRHNFKNCTSGNEKIDELIQEMRLKFNQFDNIIVEWIPYNQFKDIKEIGRDDSIAIFLAIWMDVPLKYDACYKREWKRVPNKKVALKCLYNSNHVTNEFLNEARSYTINIHNDDILKIYGISQNPETKDYIMILKDSYCNYCGKIYTNSKYKVCLCCLINNFTNQSSENEKIDDFIQEMQLIKINKGISMSNIFFEWVPYNQLNDIKEICKVDSTTIHSAIWMDGPLEYDAYYKKEWKRVPNKKVDLKYLYNSQNTINEFLNEAKLHTINDDKKNIPTIYGITQNLDTKDYIMILQESYCKYCSKVYTHIDFRWCEPCQVNNLKQNFASLTSGNEKIDEFIQEIQLNNKYLYKRIRYNNNNNLFEWIPYNQFINIKEINKSNSGILYSAMWIDGPLKYDKDVMKWKNMPNKEVKSYPNKIYGISENPDTKNYIIVLFQDHYCKNCNEIYTGNERWCKLCQVNNIKENFINWTSGNERIDNLIQEMQLKINKCGDMIIEWLPYNQFNHIKEIGKGGFATVYSAIWKDGPLKYMYGKMKYEKMVNKEVALKCVHNSQNITSEFLNEIKKYSLNEDDYILKIYGISQNPNTKDYIIVLKYAKGGSFNNYINNDIINWFWSEKLKALKHIIKGLKKFHKNKIVHHNFHTGNILLSFIDYYSIESENYIGNIYVSDMGSCEEISNIDETKIYGVMPFVAPEVLKGKPYTQAADIYSFATTKQPFANCAHDSILASMICNGIT
ncbi:Mkk2p [Rhizophagus irregularis DAOM 197198w]|uniref:Mkk2p n=1 Tax=Rhizophagus irregularis (strain DAOM 197198w) TaxID=1432141 RepID=A0A015ITL0_RHIIW|nr:Mkk2p [Rhizophagus irregularis DAOM 197198w]